MNRSARIRDVAVVGAGALGRWVAAKLSSSGTDVVLITRPNTTPATIPCKVFDCADQTGGTKNTNLSSISQDVEAGPASAFQDESFRWLLMCTKAKDFEQAVRETGTLVAADGCVAVLSNGLGHADTLGACGIEKSVAAIVTYGLFAAEDGSVQLRGSGGKIEIGPLNTGHGEPATHEQSQDLAHRLDASGVAACVVADGGEQVWRKAMLNAGINPVAALLGCENGALPQHGAFALSVEAAREVQAVGIAAGVDLAAIDPEQALRDLCRDTATNRCSTLQDLDAGRTTEMDWICGAVVRAAQKEQQEAPVNRLLGSLVRDVEMSQTAN